MPLQRLASTLKPIYAMCSSLPTLELAVDCVENILFKQLTAKTTVSLRLPIQYYTLPMNMLINFSATSPNLQTLLQPVC